MGYQTTLLDDLRRFGVPVEPIQGWQTRGASTISPKVGVNHHTAGPRAGVAPSLRICIEGRPDVPGPLCNVLLGRDNVARLIAAGRSNNAGKGGWRGITGNSNTLGLEVEHVGTLAEPVTDESLEMQVRIQAAFAWNRYSADMVCQHYEWAPTRKIDYVKSSVPEFYNPDQFRRQVADLIRQGGYQPPKPPPPSQEQEIMGIKDDLIAHIDTTKPYAFRSSKDLARPDGKSFDKGRVYVVSALGIYPVNRPTLNGLYVGQQIRQDERQQPKVLDPDFFVDIPWIG